MISRNKVKVALFGIVTIGLLLLAGRLAAPSGISPSLPNLMISNVFYELETDGSCLISDMKGYFGVSVVVINNGKGDAGSFDIGIGGTGQIIPQGLVAGKSIRVWFPGGSGDYKVNVRVDAVNRVMETNEDDNTLQDVTLAIPTLPTICSSTPTPILLNVDQMTDVLMKAKERLLPSDSKVNYDCVSTFNCWLAAGHQTNAYFTAIGTPISVTDEHYHGFHNTPMLIWEEVSHIVATGTDRNIIWQIGGWEIHITSFDDTSFKIALDPLLVAEVIYEIMVDSGG